jgi:YebC/PmpR family DNA-binding regulatory protein
VSGHSRWATIKRTKGAADVKRGKLFSKISKEIMVATRVGGGDPSANPRLRRAIDLARANNVTNDKIHAAIKKATGEGGTDSYEEIVYEAVGPAGVLVLIQVLTDNRNRTLPELRKIFEKHGGAVGAAGSAAWAFDLRGVIAVAKEAATEEQLIDVGAAVGAEDVVDDGEEWTVTTVRESLDAVRDALERAAIPCKSAQLLHLPKAQKSIDGADARKMIALLEALEDHDDVQNVASEADFSDAALAEAT